MIFIDSITAEDSEKWGLDILAIALHSKNYGWDNIVEPEKKYMLTDLDSYEGKINISTLAAHWRETGHSEWEYVLAAWTIYSVIDALKKNEDCADISLIFTRDLIAANERRFMKEQVYNHVMPSFEKVDEDAENIYLRLRVA